MEGLIGVPPSSIPRRFAVGTAEIRPDTNTVIREGRERYLRQQAMQVLVYLLDRPGELVSKEDLHRSVWNNTAVTDDALVQCVVEIRKALGDDSRKPRFVRTVPKGGYCFIGPVSPLAGEAPSINAAAPPVPAAPVIGPARRPRTWWWAAAALVVVSFGAAVQWAGWLRSSAASARVEWPSAPGKLRVFVLPFDNPAGPDDLDWLRHGLPEMMATDLARSPGISVLSPTQILRLRGGRLDPDLPSAVALAKEAAADAFVTGSFSAVGNALRVDARIYQADGTPIGAETLTAARREAVLGEIDRLAADVSRRLGHPLDADQAASRLSDVMTADLAAFREYSLGVENGAALQSAAALAHFEAAIHADPRFAMAYARIGYTYAVTIGRPARGEASLAKAFQLSDRLREQDRLSILAWYALAKLDFEGALTPLRTLVSRYPDEVENYWLLARVLRGEERWDEALSVVNSGLRVNPNAKDLYNELCGLHETAGRLESALAAAKKYVALSPQEANAHDTLGLTHQQAGRYDEAIASYERALAIDPAFDIAVIHLGNTFFEQGRYRDALKVYARHVEMVPTGDMKLRGLSAQAWVQFYRGDLDGAWRLVNSPYGDHASPRYDIALIALARGNRQRFDLELRKPLNYSNRGTRFPLVVQRYLRGRAAQANHQPEVAIENFRDATRHAPMLWTQPTFEDCLAQGLFDYGRLDEAAVEYRRLLSRNPRAARYHYRLAQIADQQHRQADAEGAYRTFLELWAQADADIPEVVAARAWLARASTGTPDDRRRRG